MTAQAKILDVMALLEDVPQQRLSRDQLGTESDG